MVPLQSTDSFASYPLIQCRPYSISMTNYREKLLYFLNTAVLFSLSVCCNGTQQMLLSRKHCTSLGHSYVNTKNTCKYGLILKHSNTLNSLGHKWCKDFYFICGIRNSFRNSKLSLDCQYNWWCETAVSLRRLSDYSDSAGAKEY